MNDEHKEVLRKVLVDFVGELDHLDLVVQHLQLDGVLNDSDRDSILNQPSISQGEKVRDLLEILPEKGLNAFGSFFKALKLHHINLAWRLEYELVFSNVQVKEVFKAKSRNVGYIVDTLFLKNILSLEEKRDIEQYRTNEAKVEELLRILPSAQVGTFGIIIELLRSRQETELVSLLKNTEEKVKRFLAESHDIPSDTTVLEQKEPQPKRDETRGLNQEIEKLQNEKKEESAAHEKLKKDNETQKTTHCTEVMNVQDRISRLEKQLDEETAAHEELKIEFEKMEILISRKMHEYRDTIFCLKKELKEVKDARNDDSAAHGRQKNDDHKLNSTY